MSNALAVAAVTRTLRSLLEAGFKTLEEVFPEPIPDTSRSGITVTTLPPDEANKTNEKQNAVNLFLYHAEQSATWRNADLPRTTRPNEVGQPPLALNLYYLLTAYAESKSDHVSHVYLGRAMSVLHDHPLLSRERITEILGQSRLQDQVERIRITSQPLSIDEMSKMWTTFQTQYRLSTAYEASVVLIESTQPPRAALPVLTRGEEDTGAFVQASRAPTLASIEPPRSQPSARLGEELVITGAGLDAGTLRVRMSSLRPGPSVTLEPKPGTTASELRVPLPDAGEDMARWAPGFHTAAAVVKAPPPAKVELASNQVAWALAPRIAVTPTSALPGDVELSVTCTPRMRDDQRAVLLLTRRSKDDTPDERQIEPASVTNPPQKTDPTTLTFRAKEMLPGIYQVRLRVDGVDSIPVVWKGTPERPQFDRDQAVEVKSP